MVSDASVGYNKCICRVQEKFESYIVKKINIRFKVIIALFG